MIKSDLIKGIAGTGVWSDDVIEQGVDRFIESAAKMSRKGSTRFPHTVEINGTDYPYDEGEVSYKFPRPAFYKYPSEENTGVAVGRIVRAFAKRRHLFIYGEAGCGKSAIVRALGHDFNRECSHYAMRESLDPELYLGRTVIEEVNGASVTRFEKGPLLLDFEGRIGADGVRRPVTICFDDMDRAPAIYHEILRHVMDDNAKSVFIPELKISLQIFDGTQIVATANSNGRGDSSSLYATAQQMDESILDRFNVVIHFPFMTKAEETALIQKRFAHIPKGVLEMMVQGGSYIRGGINKGDIYGSFSHRRLLNWVQSVSDLVEVRSQQKKNRDGVIMEAAKDWMDWFDPQQREVISRSLGPIIVDTEKAWK